MLHGSHDFLFIVFELQDNRLDILALTLPLLDALLGIRIEVLLLLVLQGLVVHGLVLLVDEFLLCLDVLFLCLLFQVVRQLDPSLSFLLSFLLLGNGQLLVSQLPEFGELHFFLLLVRNLHVFAINLVLSTLFNCVLHFLSSHLFFFEQDVRLVLGFSNLLVKHFFLLISDFHELVNLSINQCLSDRLLLRKSLSLLLSFQMLQSLSLLRVLLDSSVFFLLLDRDLSLNLEKFFIGLFILVSLLSCSLSS